VMVFVVRAASGTSRFGARGRLVGIRRQPTASVVRALRRFFPEDFKNADGLSDEKKAAALLAQHGKFRVVETASGPQAVELFAFAKGWLSQNGYRILADEVR